MNRTLPGAVALVLAGVALLLGVAATGAALGVDAGWDQQDSGADNATGNTTERLGLPGDPPSAFVRPGTDASGALAAGDAALRSEFSALALQHRLDDADGPAERRRVVEGFLDGMERRVEALARRERAAIEAYAEGSASKRELLRVLATVDGEARAILSSYSRLQEAYDVDLNAVDRERVIVSSLSIYTSPAREYVREHVRPGEDATPDRVQIRATEDGLALELIAGDEYYREVVRTDNRDPDGTDQIDGNLGEVAQLASELYPWASSHPLGSGYHQTHYDHVYHAELDHPQGRLSVYVDGSTRTLIREHQTLRLDELPRSVALNETNESIRIVVERTPRGGPARVTVRHEETGDVIDARIRVNGTFVGTTDRNGQLWLLEPDEEYVLTATTAPTTVNVTVPAA